MTTISRRKLIKIGAASAALLALERQFGGLGLADELISGGRSVSRTTGRERHAVASTCMNCPARCGILGFVDDGVLMKIEGNPEHPNNRGRLCSKGLAGLNQLYNPDRVLHPKLRVGPRGENKWRNITWDEAYTEITSKLKSLRDDNQSQNLVIASGRNGREGIVGRFAKAFGTAATIDESSLGQANKFVAHELTWGIGQEVYDAANSKYFLNFGANPYETHQFYNPLIQRLVEGRATGAKLVTFDPRLSNTAGKSDEWFPIRPGTDGLVALAMANVIMQQGLFDSTFLNKWTNYSASELAAYLSEYTLNLAQKISGIRAADIARLAVEFATTKPAIAISGGGVVKHRNGTQNERCVTLLNAITGNVDVRGGYCLPRAYQFAEPEPIPTNPLPASELSHPSDQPFASLGSAARFAKLVAEGRQKVGALIAYEHDLVYAAPDSRGAAAVLRNEKLVPFFVAIDSYQTETSALADIILPAATYLERWEVHSPPSFSMVPFVSISQPVVKPLGESRSFFDIARELAQRLGGGMEKMLSFPSAEEYVRASLTKIAGLTKMGGVDYLKEHGVWHDPVSQPNYKSYESGGFNTPSGVFEILSKRLAEKKFAPLPTYEPIPDHDSMTDDQLYLIVYQWNVHTGERTGNCKWLAEIVHDNRMLINPLTAKARDIKDGDHVEVTSLLSKMVIQVRVSEGIHPQVVAIGDSCGHWEFGRIAQAKKFKSSDADTQILWWEREGNGVHPNPIIPVDVDSLGGGQAWMDTVVTVRKA